MDVILIALEITHGLKVCAVIYHPCVDPDIPKNRMQISRGCYGGVLKHVGGMEVMLECGINIFFPPWI